jgi:uncharacterized membrane protein (UPF0127 family)
MKKQIITIHYKNKRIKITAENCNLLEKFIGLMFSRRQKAKILLFNFDKKQKIRIHSLFVFYPFLAVWLNEQNRIADLKIVKPFSLCISPKKPAFNLVEIPINYKNKKIIKFFFPTRRKV